MTLDEAITYVEDIAKEQDKLSKRYDDASGYSRSHNDDIRTSDAKKCERCAEDHRQLAGWLKDYKRLKEQELCDDCISRQVAIDAFEKFIHELGIEDEPYNYGEMALSVKNVPPVNPQPKVGHWIDVFGGCECSECGCLEAGYSDYCPDCGAKMEESEKV